MATTPPLSLSDIVDISVTVAPSAASVNPFNQGLFIGTGTVIPTTERVRKYAASTFSQAMLTDGFLATSHEYIAMQIYFSQTPQPSFGWVGIKAGGESWLQAAQACRNANQGWYGLTVDLPLTADNLALAQWADPIWESTRYYAYSDDVNIPAGTAGNCALQLQTLKMRVLGIYSTTQTGLYPNNIFAAVGLMGVEMGFNTGLAGSFFTVAHKQIAGIATEPLTETQYGHIQAASFNVYANFAPYELLEPGFMSNGSPSYLWLFLAMLVANLQIEEVNVLASYPAVPQTNVGQQLLIGAANAACAKLSDIGFLSGAIWEGLMVLSLKNGDALPLGYLNQSEPYAKQLPGDRAAGKAMPIYCTITTSGAVLSLVIAVYTQL
jgi:hypothetical protein